MKPVVMKGVCKTYRLDRVEVPAAVDVDLVVYPNRFTVLSGPSGSGKTTLLNLMGGIDRPDRGEIVIDGKDTQELSDDEMADFRARHIGFVFQNFNLIPTLNAFENIEYPLRLMGMPREKRREQVMGILDEIELGGYGERYPGELSGGQRQRVAIGRALACMPALVLADEPTANLDSRTGDAIIALMRRMQQERGMCFVFSSHDQKVLAAADDVVHIRDGRVVGIERERMAVSAPEENV